MNLKRLKCLFTGHKFQIVLFGYPKNQIYWQEFHLCTHCKKWKVTIDDLFAETRPYNLPMDQDWMTLDESIRTKKYKTFSKNP